MDFLERSLPKLLKFALANGASDIHLHSGEAPALRIEGTLSDIKSTVIPVQDMEALAQKLVKSQCALQNATTVSDLDGSIELPNIGRFRFNLYRELRGPAVIFRVIPPSVPSIDQLNLPAVLKSIAIIERGLLLVTGATGSGKSSTIAAMLNHINETKRAHIVTIEDPVEFIHKKIKARFSYREVGRDTKNFAQALKSVLRQDPDVLFVGELRDVETAEIALNAAETGKAVFSTVHTTDARHTVSRIVSMFPSQERSEIRKRLAGCLRASVSQRLVKSIDGKGRIAAIEIFVNNILGSECIANPEKLNELQRVIERNRSIGSQSFDQHLLELLAQGRISRETVDQAASNKHDVNVKIRYAEDSRLAQNARENSMGVELDGTQLENTENSNPALSSPSQTGNSDHDSNSASHDKKKWSFGFGQKKKTA